MFSVVCSFQCAVKCARLCVVFREKCNVQGQCAYKCAGVFAMRCAGWCAIFSVQNISPNSGNFKLICQCTLWQGQTNWYNSCSLLCKLQLIDFFPLLIVHNILAISSPWKVEHRNGWEYLESLEKTCLVICRLYHRCSRIN